MCQNCDFSERFEAVSRQCHVDGDCGELRDMLRQSKASRDSCACRKADAVPPADPALDAILVGMRADRAEVRATLRARRTAIVKLLLGADGA
jgi:hypothetical protein